MASEHASDSARQLVELMETAVRRHAGDAEQSDDITILAIRWQTSHVPPLTSHHIPEQSSPTRSLSPLYSHLSPLTTHLSLSASMDDIGLLAPFVANAAGTRV